MSTSKHIQFGRLLICSFLLLVLTTTNLQARATPQATSFVYLPMVNRAALNVAIRNEQTANYLWNTRLISHETSGEVVNLSEESVFNIVINLTVYNEETGEPIELGIEPTLISQLLPGEAAPFLVRWSHNPQAVPTIRTNTSLAYTTTP
jgi:hypothetical protein